uniref:Solute carrier family 15 member 1 n=1 Tax=Chelydra serpentina TaxID=8475 RepID=A0A8C3XVT5_CHESE
LGLELRIPSCFGFPLSIFFIVINEFCERFSYYGMRAVLVLYFKFFLHWDDNLSTAIYHTFVALCYLTPILGAIIADSWLGKFKTIISLSIVYTVGQAVMAVSSINDLTDYNRDGTPDNIPLHIGLSISGLILIAFGTGGIKPCVSAFGGDQFEEEQEKQRSRFFSLFYLSVNAGSLLSTIITPILRGEECGIHTKQQCYPLAFGVPAALMAVSLMVFILGSKMYKKAHPQGNIMLQVSKCIGFAVKNRFQHRSKQFSKREHWLDWASEKYDKRLITQTKMVLRVLFLYIPLPMFWALFDQQGSRWTLQATTMDGNFGAIQIQPDQMQTVNPILIVVMVPIVDTVVYPLIKKCHINFTPLRKITVGMFLASLAFVAAALVQVQIDVSKAKHSQMMILLFSLLITIQILERVQMVQTMAINNFFLYELTKNVFIKNRGKGTYWYICVMECNVIYDKINKLEEFLNSVFLSHIFILRKRAAFSLLFSNVPFSLLLFQCNSNTLALRYVEDIQPNTVHMAWQIPQYFIMTCGEVVFSVTGLAFSYSQAPSNMKSVLQAGWLLTVAVGNIIVLIVAGASKLSEQWAEYVLFAALLMAVCIIFSIMAYFYTYVDPVEIEAQLDEDEKKKMENEKSIYENGTGPISQSEM